MLHLESCNLDFLLIAFYLVIVLVRLVKMASSTRARIDLKSFEDVYNFLLDNVIEAQRYHGCRHDFGKLVYLNAKKDICSSHHIE